MPIPLPAAGTYAFRLTNPVPSPSFQDPTILGTLTLNASGKGKLELPRTSMPAPVFTFADESLTVTGLGFANSQLYYLPAGDEIWLSGPAGQEGLARKI